MTTPRKVGGIFLSPGARLTKIYPHLEIKFLEEHIVRLGKSADFFEWTVNTFDILESLRRRRLEAAWTQSRRVCLPFFGFVRSQSS